MAYIVLNTTPASYEVNITKTNTWDDDFVIVDSSGSPVVLTGSTIECSIKSSPSNVSSDASLVIGNGISITGTDNNIINVFKAISIPAGRYYWDIRVTFPSGKVVTYVGGIMNVVQNITP